MNELAPIGISTYNRIKHLRRTIQALQANTLAKQSRLFIFSDAPRKGDEDKVKILRQFLYSIKGFKSVEIIERLQNSRVENSRGGIQQLLRLSGRCIFMEDDIVTAPGFLKFMNDALTFYEHHPKVLNVTGYSFPFDTEDFGHDVFFLSRFNGWGVGFWQEKFESVKNVTNVDYKSLIADKNELKTFIKAGGEDMLALIDAEASGQIDAYDVKAMFHQFKSNTLTLYPKYSLVQNIGNDSSGVHCRASKKFLHERLWDKTDGFTFNESPEVYEHIRRANFKFHSLGYRGKFGNFAKINGVYHILKKVKNIFL